MKYYKYGAMILVLTGFLISAGNASGTTGLSVYGTFSKPLGGLSEWFKAAPAGGIAVGFQKDQNWYVFGALEYSRFDDENIDSYISGKLDLFLEHTGLLVNGNYALMRWGRFSPYLHMGTGLYYWKGTRGEIQPDDTVDPAIPFMEAKTLEEWNWGFRGGFGLETNIIGGLNLDLLMYYRFIVGDLWPTLQPHVELESVSGFQTLNVTLQLRYYFKR